MNAELYNEITSTYTFEMVRESFYTHARMFLTGYKELSADEKNIRPSAPYLLTASTDFQEKIYLGNASRISRWEDLDETDFVINVIHFSGPMMRSGGACAYGSKELRQMIIDAANVKQCIGQIFIVDTPGGSSFTKFDLQEAMTYLDSKNQMSAMIVDGWLCSAGMAWGALCQKRYARTAHSVFGCMGTFAAYYTSKNGDENAITKDVLHEVYADDCPEKNRSMRDSAEGDDTRIKEEVTKSNQQYKDIIKKGIPKVTDEQLLGGTWEASEVIGTLCDGIKSLDEVVNEMLAAKGISIDPKGKNQSGNLYSSSTQEGMQSNASTTEGCSDGKKKKSEKPDADDDPEDDDPNNPGNPNEPIDPNDPEKPDDDDDKKSNSNQTNKKNMGKKYTHIQAVLGLEVLESGSKDNSLWLHENHADVIEAFAENAEKTTTALEAKSSEVRQLTESIKTLKADHTSKIEVLNNTHATALESAKKEAAAEVQKEVDKLAQEKADLEKQLSEAKKEKETLTETISKKDEDIKELSKEPGSQKNPVVPAPQAGGGNESGIVLPSSYGTVKEQKEARARLMEKVNGLK